MNFQLTLEQQRKLLELYQSFNIPDNGINIKIKPTNIDVKVNGLETTLIVPEGYQEKKRKHIDLYIEEAYNADFDFDMSVHNEEDLQTLLKFSIDTTITNGQRILAYSKIWTQVTRKIENKEVTSEQVKRIIWSSIKRNGTRFLRIAQRAHKVMDIMGDYFPRKLELITPTWLQHLKVAEFDNFVIRSRAKYRKGIEHLTGARE
jgi:hypothetical protein